MRPRGKCSVIALACFLVAATVHADDVSVETIVTGLHRPCGVAVRPGGLPARFQLYVSDTAVGRVLRVASDAPDRAADAVTGFPKAAGDDGPLGQVGPRGLLFLDDYQLVVAMATAAGGTIRTYGIPSDRRPLSADDPRQELNLPSGGGWAIARTRANDAVPDLLVITAIGAGQADRLLKCRVQADFLGNLQPFGPAPRTADLPAPVAVAVSSQGYVAVGRAVDGAEPGATITFHSPADGTLLLEVDTGLRRLVSLAYSAATGNLYALDSPSATDQGGVYRIDDTSQPGRPSCTAVRVADVRRPTALACGPDGALYVTTLGDGAADGTLVKIAGGL